MSEYLFEVSICDNDPFWIVKEYFNCIRGHSFSRCVDLLTQSIGYGDEHVMCDFPDDIDWDEEPFEGVRFRFQDDEIVVSEEEFKYYLKLACERYVDIYPEDESKIKELLSRLDQV